MTNPVREWFLEQWETFKQWQARKAELKKLESNIRHEAHREAILRSKEHLVEKHIEEIKNPPKKKGIGGQFDFKINTDKVLGNNTFDANTKMQSILSTQKQPEVIEEPKTKRAVKRAKKAVKRKASKKQTVEVDQPKQDKEFNFNAKLNQMLNK